MVSIIYQTWLVYLGAFIPLFLMDYWNPQQVSHYLGLDLIIPIVPALIYLLVMIHLINKEKEKATLC